MNLSWSKGMEAENVPGVILGLIVSLTVIVLAMGMLTGQNAQIGKDAQLAEVDELHDLMEGQCEISNTNSEPPEDITKDIQFKQIDQISMDYTEPQTLIIDMGNGDENTYQLSGNCDYTLDPETGSSITAERGPFWNFTIVANQREGQIPQIAVTARGSEE